MKIRKAVKEDYDKIYRLVEEAFKTAKVSDGTEQDFVLKLRESENFIPELEFVIEDEERIIGHVMFTKFKVRLEEGDYIALLLAPLCVKLEYRSRKIGQVLVEHGFKEAIKLGYKAVFLVGDPNYYERFGFKCVNEFYIKNSSKIPDEYVLGCEIIEESLKDIKGTIDVIE